MFRILWNKKGQSILEYVIILTAIILGVVAAATLFQTKVETMINTAGTKIDKIDLK